MSVSKSLFKKHHKLKYKLTQVKKGVFTITTPNVYDRAMLFMRVQEFYESDNPRFRGKSFNLNDFMGWWSPKVYWEDWGGFNVPLKVAIKCYSTLKPQHITEHDVNFMQLLIKIIAQTRESNLKDAYIIGTDSIKGNTFKHELAHAFYHLYPDYRKRADALTSVIPRKIYKIYKNNLKESGYRHPVIKDEIQAYLVTKDAHAMPFSNGVNQNITKDLHKLFSNQLNRFF